MDAKMIDDRSTIGAVPVMVMQFLGFYIDVYFREITVYHYKNNIFYRPINYFTEIMTV